MQSRSKKGKSIPTKKRATKEATSGHRGKLIIGLFAEREKGQRGATPKDFLRPTVALGVKLEHTKTAKSKKKKSLSLPVLAAAVNRVFQLIPAVVNGGRKLTVKTIRRRAYHEDKYVPKIKKTNKKAEKRKEKNPKAPKVIRSYMGVTYSELDGNNADQMRDFRCHVNESGFSELIDWLIEVVFIELENPSIAKKAAEAKEAKAALAARKEKAVEEDEFEALEITKAKIKAKVFTTNETQAFKIEIDGISALNKTPDDEEPVLATAPATAPSQLTTSSESGATVRAIPSTSPLIGFVNGIARQNIPSGMAPLNEINTTW